MVAPTDRLRRLAPGAGNGPVDWHATFERELPRVFNFFRYRVADGATAEDLASETFEKAWRARARYQAGRGSVSSWLFAIARNVAVDHYRRSQRPVPADHGQVPSSEPDPEANALRRAEFERLSQLLRSLPERERELIAFKFGAEANNREIARLTGLSESNVGTILHRTVQSLRARWHEEGGEP